MIIIKQLMVYTLNCYYILIECSEVKLRQLLKIRYAEETLGKSCLKLKFHLQKKYSVFLRKFVLCNYIIISLQWVAYAHRYPRGFPIYASS